MLDQIAGSTTLAGDGAEDLPVCRAGMDDVAVWLREKDKGEVQNRLEGTRLNEDPGVGYDADHGSQHLGRHGVGGGSVHDVFEPFSVPVGLGCQLQRIPTVPTVLLRSSIRTIR